MVTVGLLIKNTRKCGAKGTKYLQIQYVRARESNTVRNVKYSSVKVAKLRKLL